MIKENMQKAADAVHSVLSQVRNKAGLWMNRVSEWLETSDMACFQAADKNDLPHLKELLENYDKSVDIQEPEGGETLLMAAVCQNNKEMVDFLLSQGASVNLQNDAGETALVYAVERDCLPIADALLKAGAKTDIEDKKGYTPVMHALKKGAQKMIMLLALYDKNLMEISGLRNKTTVSTPSYEETMAQTEALINAVLSQDEKQVQKLLDEKVNVNAGDQNGITPLMFAVQTHQIRMVEQLLRAGADAQQRSFKGERAMDFITSYLPWTEKEKMIRVLITPPANDSGTAQPKNAKKVATQGASRGTARKKQAVRQKS